MKRRTRAEIADRRARREVRLADRRALEGARSPQPAPGPDPNDEKHTQQAEIGADRSTRRKKPEKSNGSVVVTTAARAPLVIRLGLDGAELLTFGKHRRVRSKTWLAIVRGLPCAICGRSGPSDPNHYPGKGRAGGGSDLETHPACRDCHELITTHKISDDRQARAVADTMRHILKALRTGELHSGTMLAIAREVSESGGQP